MKRAIPLIQTFILIICLSVSALAQEGGGLAGTLAGSIRAPEDETPYITQCMMGSFAADAVRSAADADIALVSAADLTGSLSSGTVTRADIEAVLRNDPILVRGVITPAVLYALLEAAVSHIELDTSTERIVEGSEIYDGFCQVSGFRFRYDVSAPAGERIVKVSLDDGTELSREDVSAVLILAAPENVLNGSCGLPTAVYEPAGMTLSEALAAFIDSAGSLSDDRTGRIEMIGSRDKPLVGMIPRAALTGGLAVLAVLLVFRRTRYNKLKDEYGFTK